MLNTITLPDRFCVIDIEFIDDENLYRKYLRVDKRPAEKRWPLRKVVAANVMTLAVDGCSLEVTGFKSFSGPDEDKLLVALFAHMVQHSDHRLVTWAGCSADVPILRAGACANGLKLPPQLIGNRRLRNGEFEHLDLAIVMKGGAGQFCHLSEMAVRCGIPVKMGGTAMAIPDLVRTGRFRPLEWLAEADTITTACVLAAYLASMGLIASTEAAQHNIIKFVGNVQQRLRQRMAGELQRWMDRAE